MYGVQLNRLPKGCVSSSSQGGPVHFFAHFPLHSFQDTQNLLNRRATVLEDTVMERKWPRSIWNIWCRLVSSFALGSTNHAWGIQASKQPRVLLHHEIVITLALDCGHGALAARINLGEGSFEYYTSRSTIPSKLAPSRYTHHWRMLFNWLSGVMLQSSWDQGLNSTCTST